jgi:hypothetical protein
MAISDAQKVDYLFKKLGFGVAKTDTSTNKSPANESISSPLLIRGDSMYISADQITSTPTLLTGNVAGIVSVYRDTLSSSVQATNDGTAATNRTWKTNLTDWIGPEFGAGYAVKVYTGSGGSSSTAATLTALPVDGSGNNDSWFFDYQSGVLNFADTNVPSTIGAQIWVVGARYVGGKGVAALTASAAQTGNVSFYSNVDAFTTNQTFYPTFGNISTVGNTKISVSSALGYNPSTGTLTTTVVNAAHNGSIGATTPNTAAFTTATAGGLQAGAIGNVTPGTGVFTTGTFNTATTGGLQAGAIGNVTPGLGYFTTANATNLYAATIGNATTALNGSTATITSWANITATTAATSTTTGALIVAGGIGVAGNVYSGYTVTAANIQTTGSNGNISGVSNLFASNVIATTVNAATIGNTGAAITGNAGTLTSLQVIAIGNVTPGTAVFTTANASGIQATAIGNITPGTAVFTTANATAIQATAIGNITPGTAVFTTANATAIQATAIGNITPGTGTFTTANATTVNATTVNAATIGNTGATHIGANVTITSTVIAATVNAATIGNASAVLTGAYGNITTINATNVNAITVGNVGASVVGNGGFLSNIIGANVVGTVATANVSMYDNIASSTTNATYYPQLADKSSGNVATVVATGVNVNPSTSTISALGFVGGTGAFTTLSASGATTVTAATQSTSSGTGALIVTGGAGIGANLYVGGNATIIGNLTVVGTTTSVQSTTLDVSDLNITVAKGAATAAAANGAGLTVDGAGATLLYTNATDTWNLNKGLVGTTTTMNSGNIGGLQATAIGNITPGTAVFTTATAGGFQANSIGNINPGTAFFTTANATNIYALTIGNASTTLNGNVFGGNANLTSTTAATSTTTGALQVAGGAGVAGNVYIGGSLVTTGVSGNISGVNTVFTTTVNATSINSATIGNIGAILRGDGSNISNISLGSISGTYPTANVSMYSNVTFSTANQTYSLVFSNIGQTNGVSGNTILSVNGYDTAGASYNPSTGLMTVGSINTGALGTSSINNTLTIISSGNIVAASSAPSTSTTTGSFIAKGGAGVAGNLNVGGNVNITGITTHTGNVAFDGGQVTHYDSIIDLHTYGNLAAWSTDDGKDIGLRLHYYNGADALAFVGLENSTKTLQFLINATEVAGNVTGTYGNIWAGSQFLSNTTASTSTTTGALQVAGGAGIAGNVYVGTNLVVLGDTSLSTANIGGLQAKAIGNVTPGTGAFTTVTTTGNVTVGGNIAITGNIVPSANITYSLGTSSLRFKDLWLSGQTEYLGGAVIGEDANGNLNLTTATGNRVTIASTSNIVAVTGNVVTPWVLGNIIGATGTFTTSANITGTGTSTSTTTGALVVAGGAGIAGNVYVGTNTVITGTLNVTGESTLTTGTVGGLQAKAIGNITPGTYTFTTGNVTALQATVIGNITPGTAVFTTANSTIANITGTTASTTNTTGALVVAGGVGIGGNIVAGATSGSVHALQGNLLIGPAQSSVSADSSFTINQNTDVPLLFPNAVSHISTVTGKTGWYAMDVFGTFVGGNGGGFFSRRARGTSGAPSAVQGGDVLGTLAFKGYGTTGYSGPGYNPSGLRVGAAESFSDNSQATYLELMTTNTGSNTATQSVFIDYTGNVVINANTASTTSTTGALVVKGGAGIVGRVNIDGNTAVNSTLYGRGVYDNGVQVVSTSTGGGSLSISSGAINLSTYGPGVATTGSSTLIPVITTDAYGRISSITTSSIAAVADAANVAFYTQTVSLNNNQTFYPTFSNVNGGNSIPGTSSLLSYNAFTGRLTSSAAAVNGGLTSTSYTDGALVVTGGVGISGAVNTAGGITAAGKVITTNNEDATSTTTGAIQATGGISTQANLYVGKAAIFNNSQTAGMDIIARGKNDATLIWARPSASYDTVIIGNSAVAGNVVAGAKLNINTTDSIKLPVGTSAQRPGNQGQTDVTGMFRYSTTQGTVEWYNGANWQGATTQITVITDEQFNGDGSSTDFTLASATTTASTIVSINGVMQIPTLAYSVVSSTTLRFTEAPGVGDVIDVRRLTTTTTVTGLSDANGYNAMDVDSADGVTLSTGTAAKNARWRIDTDGSKVSLLANTAVASANVATTVDTVDTTKYRSAKYVIQATNGANYQVTEALLISNGTTTTVMAYGTIQTNGNLGVVTATQSGSNALLQFVALSSSTNVRISKEYILI